MKKFFVNLLFLLTLVFTFCLSANAIYYGPSWESDTLNVYIQEDSKYNPMMKRAFLRWQSASGNKIKINYVTDLEDKSVNVVVNFSEKVDGSDGEVGSYMTFIQGGFIKNAKITIAAYSPQKYSDDLVYTTMLHEIGHIFGLPDTNRNLGIMHYPVNESQDIITNDVVKLYRFNRWSTVNQKINIRDHNF